MAKKKKSDKLVNQETLSLGYRGELDIKIKNANRVLSHLKIHNTGTDLLFEQICNALLGYSFSRPIYLNVGTSPDNIDRNRYSLANEINARRTRLIGNQLIPIATAMQSVAGGDITVMSYKAQWTATLSYSVVKDHKIREIGLFSDYTGDTLLARIITPEIELNSGQTLLLNWTMEVTNSANIN